MLTNNEFAGFCNAFPANGGGRNGRNVGATQNASAITSAVTSSDVANTSPQSSVNLGAVEPVVPAPAFLIHESSALPSALALARRAEPSCWRGGRVFPRTRPPLSMSTKTKGAGHGQSCEES